MTASKDSTVKCWNVGTRKLQEDTCILVVRLWLNPDHLLPGSFSPFMLSFLFSSRGKKNAKKTLKKEAMISTSPPNLASRKCCDCETRKRCDNQERCDFWQFSAKPAANLRFIAHCDLNTHRFFRNSGTLSCRIWDPLGKRRTTWQEIPWKGASH